MREAIGKRGRGRRSDWTSSAVWPPRRCSGWRWRPNGRPTSSATRARSMERGPPRGRRQRLRPRERDHDRRGTGRRTGAARRRPPSHPGERYISALLPPGGLHAALAQGDRGVAAALPARALDGHHVHLRTTSRVRSWRGTRCRPVALLFRAGFPAVPNPTAMAYRPFPAPPRQTGQAVLPHPAYRRPSPDGIRFHPPRPVRPRCDNPSTEREQTEAGRMAV